MSLYLGFSLCTDGKDSTYKKHLINAILVTPDTTTFLFTIDVGGTTQDADATAAAWIGIVDRVQTEYGPYCKTFDSDTLSVNKAASSKLMSHFPGIMWVYCAAHCINLNFKDTVVFPLISTLWSQETSIVHMFYTRTRPRYLLRTAFASTDYPGKISSNPLKGEHNVCEVRFANIFYVIARLVRIQSVLKAVSLSDELNNWISKLPKRDDRKSCRDVSELLASRAFWMAVKEYVRLL